MLSDKLTYWCKTQHNIEPDFQKDIILVAHPKANKPPYISEWYLPFPQPTEAELEAITEEQIKTLHKKPKDPLAILEALCKNKLKMTDEEFNTLINESNVE